MSAMDVRDAESFLKQFLIAHGFHFDRPSPTLGWKLFKEFAREPARCADDPPPTSVVPDPNGGIVFHRRHQEFSEEFHFWDDGEVDYCRFQDIRLVERRPI